jgi:hypothetical protein
LIFSYLIILFISYQIKGCSKKPQKSLLQLPTGIWCDFQQVACLEDLEALLNYSTPTMENATFLAAGWGRARGTQPSRPQRAGLVCSFGQ